MFSITGQEKKNLINTDKKAQKSTPSTNWQAHTSQKDNQNHIQMPIAEPTAFTIRTEVLLLFLFCFQFILPKSVLFSGLDINNKK